MSLEAQGVRCDFFVDSTRPTTRKQRFRALNKTLLRVNHLRHHAASADIQAQDVGSGRRRLAKNCDLVLFSCFNYGCLPQDLVDAITAKARAAGVMLAADSQASSQLGDVSRLQGHVADHADRTRSPPGVERLRIRAGGGQRTPHYQSPRRKSGDHARRRGHADKRMA